ncbi:type II toxin-antitoxin system VapB family antitoxin [Streptomyces sp. NPDC057474]|uniref:type II toxin-antitoxin system VapB family antitoxin n=1 Tax=Streptomyces sp. NPDC057474 TaxID=3346144 RepID=UPI0036BDE368
MADREVGRLAIHSIDLDDDALAEAMRLMGSTTKQDTVNRALREYVARAKRLEAAERMAARGARGQFDAAAASHVDAKRARRSAFG